MVPILCCLILASCSADADPKKAGHSENDANTPKSAGTDQNADYRSMSEEEKIKFITAQTGNILDKFGRKSGDEVPPEGIDLVKKFVDGYAARVKNERTDSCAARDWVKSDLTSVLERGKQQAPKIIKAFDEKDIDPAIGLYLAMIESEFCPCLQSPTGPLGMFQLPRTAAKKYGLETTPDADPTNPDERCDPDKAAKAEASLMVDLIAYTKDNFGPEYGSNALGIPLAISAVNSDADALKKNLSLIEKDKNKSPGFWQMMENSKKLSDQFQRENLKYFPKFLAAAIIGENPSVFGVTGIEPLTGSKR